MNNFGFYSGLLLALSLVSTLPAKESKESKTHFIDQKSIPLLIKNSGEYILTENVSYSGSDSAIKVIASNVKLRLNNHSIHLKNSYATGIEVSNASEIEIEGDAIKDVSCSPAAGGNGIHLSNANFVFLSKIFTEGKLYGVLIENSTDITVSQSQFLNASNSAASIQVSKNVAFESCTFAESGMGAIFSGSNRDCRIINSDFPSALFNNLLVQQMDGMLVDNCTFTNVGGNPGKLNLVQFGDAPLPQQVVNDLIFTNCTIINRPLLGGNTAPEGLGLYNVSGVLVDSCVIDIDNTGQPQEQDKSGIHIGNGAGLVGANVTIRNTIVQGPATDGFYPDIGSTNIVIDNCLATGALKNGIFLAGTSFSVVQNCTVVSNGTNGIFLGEASLSNAVLNNTVANNGFNIITPDTDPSLPPTGCGVGIAADSSENLIMGNQIFKNAISIGNDGSGNVILNNTTF
jgi:parallel beta-helix repeat protein